MEKLNNQKMDRWQEYHEVIETTGGKGRQPKVEWTRPMMKIKEALLIVGYEENSIARFLKFGSNSIIDAFYEYLKYQEGKAVTTKLSKISEILERLTTIEEDGIKLKMSFTSLEETVNELKMSFCSLEAKVDTNAEIALSCDGRLHKLEEQMAERIRKLIGHIENLNAKQDNLHERLEALENPVMATLETQPNFFNKLKSYFQ